MKRSVSPESAASRFQRPQGRRADGQHALTRYGPARGFRDEIPLGMHAVFLDVLGPDRLEGAGAHVQRDGRDRGSPLPDLSEHLRIEMQARGRRRDRARAAPRRPSGSARRPRRPGTWRDVGRQRHAAAALEHRGDRLGEAHAHEVVLAAEHLDGDAVADREPMARLERVPGVAERERLALAEDALDEELDAAAGALAAEQARLDDARVVQHQRVARVDQVRQIARTPGPRCSPLAAVQVQQPARGAFLRWMLGDEFVAEARNRNRRASLRRIIESAAPAGMAESVDAADSKSADREGMRVRVSLPAPGGHSLSKSGIRRLDSAPCGR